MKRFMALQVCLAFMMLILSVFLITGCGSNGQTGHWLPGLPESSNPDITKPTVTAVVPLTGDTVSINTKVITAAFSEAMLASTITATGTFTLACPGYTPVTAPVVTYLDASNLATLTLSSDLPSSTICTATITTAATDLAGNALASNYVWTFTTGTTADNTAPTVTLTFPADGVTGVAINSAVTAKFSKAMNPSTISTATFTLQEFGPPLGSILGGTVTYDPLTWIAVFTPTSNLAASTEYKATVTAVAADLAGNTLVVPAVGSPPNPWTFTTGTGLASGAVALGSAGTFGLMATAAITAATGSTINGDVSLEPGTSMTGFPPAVVNGNIHINDSISHQARADLLVAYNQAKGLACATNVGTADLGGLYVYPTGIPPGVYCSGSTMLIGAHIVLDAGGNANAVWVFQIGSSLTSNADVTLTGGAQAKNVFWVPTFDVSIGSGTTFNGTIVAGRDATSAGSATINGRILAGATTAGTIALNGPPSTVTVP
jgi:Ice-binding-like/Bacterial Ig-like domain